MQKFCRHVELGSLIALPSALSSTTTTVASLRDVQAKVRTPMSNLIFAVEGAKNDIAHVGTARKNAQGAHRQNGAEALLDRRISLRCIV
jgi:hypothetical protein